jgi:hypothetical protein
MATKSELQRENDALLAAMQEARTTLDRALGVEDEDEDAEESEGDEE